MSFSGCHPFTVFVYFIIVIGSVIINKNPIFLFINLCFAFIYKCIKRKNFKESMVELAFYAAIILIFTISVPFVSHNGKTVILFLNDNAITKEAFFLGFCTGLQVTAFLCWFSCMSHIMTGEMIIFLISGISPKFAAFISRMVRFVPMTARQFVNIYNSQKSIYPGYKPFKKRIRLFFKCISAIITWMIENSADMSDSMYARGYGLSKRKPMNIYHFRRTDRYVIFFIAFALLFTAATLVLGNNGMLFYPEIVFPKLSLSLIFIYIIWAVIAMIPYLTEICEEYRWKLLRSKI